MNRFALRSRLLFAVACLVFALFPQAASADVYFGFSGTVGGPLTFSTPDPITYTIPTTGENAVIFVIKGTGQAFDTSFSVEPVTLSYTVGNLGTATQFAVGSGVTLGNVTANDIYFGAAPSLPLTAGDIITVNPGSATSFEGNALLIPTSGFYETFIVDSNFNRLTPDGVVPEPATLALLATAGLGLMRRRR